MSFKRIANQDEVLAALDASAWVVTPGERLARAVRLAHGEARQAAGAGVWERPEVMSYHACLDRLYDGAVAAALAGGEAPPKRLARAATEAMWEQAIRSSVVGEALLQPAATAREALRAWDLCSAYRIDQEQISASGEQDAEAFAAWATEFRSRSRAQGALEDARLTDWLATQLRERRLAAPKQAVFAGFDELTPQQRELTESFKAAGSRVQVLAPEESRDAKAVRVLCADPETEIRAAASWARALLDADPSARIGIVVRELRECRGPLSRALDDALCPVRALGATVAPAYDLSLGVALADTPVVHAGLGVLELLRRRLPFELASLLLRTPFLGAAESERSGRASLELKLRERMSETLSLQNFTDFAGSAHLPRLTAMLQGVVRIAAEQRRQLPSAWAEVFRRSLADCGWPGERPLGSDEYQAVTRFRDLLGSLTPLDAVLGPVSLGATLTQLRRQAEESIFQPAAADAPVQVLGLLETAGLRFDHLWVLGLTDTVWPESPRPSAFLPLHLQREHGLPHGSAAAELAFAQRVTERLLQSADHIVASTARQQGDEALRPSPLLIHLPEAAPADLVSADMQAYGRQLQQQSAHATERYTDMRGPALHPGERAEGGTGLIRSQAACAFQAFGWYRLAAAPLGEPSLGPDAKERGKLVHEVLQTLWGELKDHAALTALDVAGRDASVQRHVARALEQRRKEFPDIYTRQLSELEQARLSAALSAWLQEDAARPPFKVVEREAWHNVKLGPLSLETRVDRTDELPDGSRVIFDYKTGEVKLKSWLEVRPDEPQLPVYATAADGNLAGLAFATLKPGKLGYLGLADRDGIAEGVTAYGSYRQQPPGVTDWPGLLQFWRRSLAALAEAYARGEAQVAPKTRQTCERCHLAMLCRVHELDADLADEETDDDA
ncbi:MAG TPA: PD-(D/E)XK nuclease family protein [Gammaproteobacteria bacterium]|nr:PD-(D/E)XK nuclease family protein [Gammaproteobacteria bacterium]